VSKTTPVRWWRDDATRWVKPRPRTLTVHAMDRIMRDWMLERRMRMTGIAIIEPRDSLLERAAPPDPWERFARDVERDLNAGRSNRVFVVDRDSLKRTERFCTCNHSRLSHDWWGNGDCTECDCQFFSDDPWEQLALRCAEGTP
jgi:hypothetical protein